VVVKVVGIDVWFWRAASIPVWERIQREPDAYNAIVGETWAFEPIEGRDRARMFLDQPADDLRDETTWPHHHKWFADKLSVLYGKIAPKLRQEISVTATAVAGA
jgi:hypothetical protein